MCVCVPAVVLSDSVLMLMKAWLTRSSALTSHTQTHTDDFSMPILVHCRARQVFPLTVSVASDSATVSIHYESLKPLSPLHEKYKLEFVHQLVFSQSSTKTN